MMWGFKKDNVFIDGREDKSHIANVNDTLKALLNSIKEYLIMDSTGKS